MLDTKARLTDQDVFQNAVRETGISSSAFLSRLTPNWQKEAGTRRGTTHTTIKLDDPTLKTLPNGGRLWLFPQNQNKNHSTIADAHAAESLLTQATDKYTDLINKEEFLLKCKTPEPAEYLRTRFRVMSLVTGIPWESFIKESSRGYVEFGNEWWVKARVDKKTPQIILKGRKLNAATKLPGVKPDATPIGGYFRADPLTMRPIYNPKNGQLKAWEQVVDGRPRKTFTLEEVIHFAYKPAAGHVLGASMYEPVLDDIRALRTVEEYIVKLLFKHLFPLLHHEVPDLTGDGHATDEEIREAVANYAGIAPDGMLVTPPGHKINVVDTKNGQLDASPYLKYLLQRVLMGLGLSEAIMGLGSAAAGMSDMLTAQMHDRVKSFQQDIERIINLKVITELLIEGGFDPIYNEDHIVSLEFKEIEIESVIRKENHEANMYGLGTLTEDEVRIRAGNNPLTTKERKKKQIYTDKIPVIQATADAQGEMQKDVATHGVGLDKELADHQAKIADKAADKDHLQAKDLATHTGKVNQQGEKTKASLAATGKPPAPKVGSAALKAPKLATRNAFLRTPAAGTVTNKDNPANKYGSRGAPRTSKSPAAGHAARKTPKSAQTKAI